MRIVIDIDGTISELKRGTQTYSDVRPNHEAVEKIKKLKEDGHYIILQTARHMKTCNGDQGKVFAKVGKPTLDWLDKYEIPYDEIHFGKPNADIYIDDLAHRFTGWHNIDTNGLNDNKVNILIPMAGRGSRFENAGFNKPKPLIDVLGKPMIEWAIKSFDFLNNIDNYQFIFIILKEHDIKHKMENELKNIFGENNTKIIKINEITRGQAETCLAAKKYIANYNKLFIYNCDTYSTSNIWNMITEDNPDGILPCFEANDHKYSYARLDEHGHVAETAEKKAISNFATNGMYYFRRGVDFVLAAEKMINNNEMENNEFYIAPVYNELIKSGKKIKIIPTEKNHVLGTPEELEKFIKQHKN